MGERWGEKTETKITANKERYKKVLIYTITPTSVAPNISDVQVQRKHTL
jgi:hypothetical protein